MFSSRPVPPPPSQVVDVARFLDPALVPLGFAPGQAGCTERTGQVIFCRGLVGSEDGGCVDLVIDVESSDEWHITDVRYWGFPHDRWHLTFDREAGIADQLQQLARTLPGILALPDGAEA